MKLCLYSLYSLNLPKLDSVTERMLGMVVPCEPLSVPNKQLCTLLSVNLPRLDSVTERMLGMELVVPGEPHSVPSEPACTL